MAEKKRAEEMEVINRKNKRVSDRKGKFDELMAKINSNNLPLEKLSTAQLKTLCAHKKRDTDTVSISKLKRNELLSLWISWKDRNDEITTLTSPVEDSGDVNVDEVPVMMNVESPECNPDALTITHV